MAYSAQTIGSLYVKATLRQPQPHGGLGDGLGRGRLAGGFRIARLRGGPILAKLAAQVAAGRAEREHRCAGIEMTQRFLFDRIDAEAGAAAVGGRDHPPIAIFADEAEAALAILEQAAARTKFAEQPLSVVGIAPPAGRADTVSGGRIFRRRCNHTRHRR